MDEGDLLENDNENIYEGKIKEGKKNGKGIIRMEINMKESL